MNDGVNRATTSPRRADEALPHKTAGQAHVEPMLELLRESEARFREFAEASSDVLWIRHAETMQWEYLSPAFEAVYGISREAALTGDHLLAWANLIVPEDRAQSLDCISRARGGEPVSFEYRIVFPKDGQLRWLRSNVFPMIDEHGRVRRIGGIGRDITALKFALDRQERLLAERSIE